MFDEDKELLSVLLCDVLQAAVQQYTYGDTGREDV
jgi:hypothetical protein